MSSFFFIMPSWRYFSVVPRNSPTGLDNDSPAEVYFKIGWSRAFCCELDEDGYPVTINFDKPQRFGPFTRVDDSITFRFELTEMIRLAVRESVQEAFDPLLQELDHSFEVLDALVNACNEIDPDEEPLLH